MIRLLLALLFTSSLLFASNALTPNNFAYGMQILGDERAAISKFEIKEDVYLKAYSKELDDVRIFDKNGNPTPFAIVEKSSNQLTSKSLDMVVFLVGSNEKNIARELEQGKAYTSEYQYNYLVKLPENSDFFTTLKSIKFDWDKVGYNWEAKVDIDFKESQSLQGRQIAEDFVIMQLQDEKQQSDLKVDSVKLNYHSLKKEESATNSEFSWIVKVSSKTKLPKITKAVGYFEEYSVETDYITFDIKSKRTSDDTLDFSLPSTQPINELNLFLHGTNFMLPIEIFYKSDKDEEWKKLKEMVLIRDTNRISMADSPLNIKKLRIKAINAHFYGDISVEAKRKELDIVFNSANNAPYILVYGSNIAGKASISEDIFLKQDDISYAYLSKEVVLAGEKAYSQKLDDENSAIPKWVIWAILGLGVVFLVFLAFKLSKEIKKDIA